MTEHLLIDSFYAQKQKTVRFEADVYDCEVIGEIPKELNGALFRVGPDRAYPTLDGDVIVNGDGVVSAFYFEDGNVDFRCRYVQTERYLTERRARRRLYGAYRNPFTDDPSVADTNRDNTANTYGFYPLKRGLRECPNLARPSRRIFTRRISGRISRLKPGIGCRDLIDHVPQSEGTIRKQADAWNSGR
jgi:hypothetical protein